MHFDFRRSRSLWRVALYAIISGLATRISLAAIGHSSAVFFFIWVACGSLSAFVFHLLILLRRPYGLDMTEQRLELREPFGATRIAWSDVVNLSVNKRFDRVTRVSLVFEGGNTSTRKSRWLGSKNFVLDPRRFDVAPDGLIEAIRSRIDAVRFLRHQKPIETSTTWSIEPSHAAVVMLFALMGFSRTIVAEQRMNDRLLKQKIGVPGVKPHDVVDRAQLDRLLKLYPRDPHVRVAHAERLIEAGRIPEALSELRALKADSDVLRAFSDGFMNLEGEVQAVTAEALIKAGQTTDAHKTVGSFCKDLDDRVFEKMRKLNLCHYS